jgi:hypothetical protein
MKFSREQMVNAARRDGLRPSATARVLSAALSAHVAMAGSATAPASKLGALGSFTSTGLTKWAGLASIVLLIGSAGLWGLQDADRAVPLHAGRRAPVVEGGVRSARVIATSSSSAPSESPSSPPSVTHREAPSAPAPVSEAESLGAVRASLRQGDAAAALQRLAVHQARFSNGQLALEAKVLRVRALQVQDPAAARREAALVLAQHPENPYRAELSRIASP